MKIPKRYKRFRKGDLMEATITLTFKARIKTAPLNIGSGYSLYIEWPNGAVISQNELSQPDMPEGAVEKRLRWAVSDMFERGNQHHSDMVFNPMTSRKVKIKKVKR